MSDADFTKLLARRRDRAIAIILGVKERECDYFLPDDVSKSLRKVILDQFNDFAVLAEDLANSNVVLNQRYLEKLDSILEHLDGED